MPESQAEATRMAAVLRRHEFDGWLCSCGGFGKGEVVGLTHRAHVAEALSTPPGPKS